MDVPLNAADRALTVRPLDMLTADELQRRVHVCVYMWRRGATSWLGRYRWRRAFVRTNRELLARAVARMGDRSGACERCGEWAATVHTMYGHGADERVTHLCGACSRDEPTGRCVVAGGRELRVSRP